MPSLTSAPDASAPYATPGDFERCRELHRRYGTTYYFATSRFQPAFRQRVHALYGFVRLPDEWVDNPAEHGIDDPAQALALYRRDLEAAYNGARPDEGVLRAFVDVARESELPLEEPLCFLDAMEMDLTRERYETYEDLQGYMRGSASAVGVMMCHLLQSANTRTLPPAMALGEAMQLTNFLRDIGEDTQRGRIYIPQEDLRRFSVPETNLRSGIVDANFRELMRFEVRRARDLYKVSDSGIEELPVEARSAVRMARILYSRILDRIEAQEFDVFTRRARTTRVEKIVVAAQVMAGMI